MPPRITSTTVRWHFGIDTADAPLKGSLYRRDRWCLMSDAVVAFRYTSRHKGWATRTRYWNRLGGTAARRGE